MRVRLATRIILGVVAIEAVMLSVLVWNSVRLINSSHAELLEKSVREESQLLAYSLAPGLAANDRAVVLDVLSLLKRKQNLVYATVLDRDGAVMAAHGVATAHVSPDNNYADALSDGVFDLHTDIVLAGQRVGALQAGYSIDGVETLTAKTRWQNAAIASVELFLSIMATVALGLFLTRSLSKLADGARALRRGEHDYRIDINSGDEIEDVADSFNTLAEHLGQAQAALAEEREALLRETRHRETLLNSIDAVVVEADPERCRFTYVSHEAENLLGFAREQWLAPDFWETHVYSDDRAWVKRRLEDNTREQGSFAMELRMMHRAGHAVWVRSINTVDVSDGLPVCRGLLLDITEQKRSEERIMYLADHDSLTGLYNRRRFQEELQQHIALAERYGHQGALMFMDLDQFKYINDSLGHQAGDQCLRAVARILKAHLRQADTLGRLGGDEFGVILPETGESESVKVASNLLNALAQEPVLLDRQRFVVSASIGVVRFPAHGLNPDELLAKADAAMYGAKDDGRNRIHLYTLHDQGLVAMRAKIHWEERIRHALEQDRFELHYQPVFELASDEIAYYEVLLRMLDDGGDLILPGAFLDIAERFGLIREIDCWVLQNAIRIQGDSERDGNPVTLSINLSGRCIGSSEVMGVVKEAIDRHGADPARIIFEVTETAAMDNVGHARDFIDGLHALGCRFALDDFGVGYASLHYLKQLPVDIVKIDGSFVRNAHQDRYDRVFIKAIHDLADGLNIVAVAEFVENEKTCQLLRDLGVQFAQGFHLARPAPQFVKSPKQEKNTEGSGRTLGK